MDNKDLKEGLKKYALRIMKLADALPKNKIGDIIGTQLVRSGTSSAANYRSACRGKSRPDFIAKLGIVVEELDESSFWMELIIESGLIKEKLVKSLIKETDELLAIVFTARKTAKINHNVK